MNGEEQQYVSRREFGELRDKVYSAHTEIEVLKSVVAELTLRYHSLPAWLTVAVSIGLSMAGIGVTLLLAGRL